MSEGSVNTVAFFKLTWTLISIFGVWKSPARNNFWKVIRLACAFVTISLVTILYPLHVVVPFFRQPTVAENIKNIAFGVTISANTIKYFWNITQISKLFEMEDILRQLDERVIDKDERNYFHTKIRKNIRNIILAFSAIYLPFGLVAESVYLVSHDHKLMYSAWFPFDWENSVVNYRIANCYQFFGLYFQLIKSLNNELLPVFALCVTAGHARLLSIRIAKIGHQNPHNYDENESKLYNCILDQKLLYRLFHLIQKIVTFPLFVQIMVNIMSLGLSLALLLFYVEEPVERFYYVLYSVGLPLQIFPACYYGTYLQLCLERLHYDAFCSNWPNQRQRYKKHLMLFVERTLKPNMVMAGGMLKISLDTFFSTCRGAYSICAVLVQRKN